MNFKELGQFSKQFQVINFQRIYRINDLPKKNKKEIIFIGKSNVGKSTLINTLLNHKINRTSKFPGCTKWIGYIELPEIVLIDLPGYGYSQVEKSRKSFWDKLINEYLEQNRIDKTFVLVDARKGISELDQFVFHNFPNPEFLLTKSDKAKKGISSISGQGIIELRENIANF